MSQLLAIILAAKQLPNRYAILSASKGAVMAVNGSKPAIKESLYAEYAPSLLTDLFALRTKRISEK